MAKLKCLRHDRRVMTVNDHHIPKLVHREDGSTCLSLRVRVGLRNFDIRDIKVESAERRLLKDIFSADATA